MFDELDVDEFSTSDIVFAPWCEKYDCPVHTVIELGLHKHVGGEILCSAFVQGVTWARRSFIDSLCSEGKDNTDF